MEALEFSTAIPTDAENITFQFCLKGYDPEKPRTSNLLKWANAPSREALQAFLKRQAFSIKIHDDLIDVVSPTFGWDSNNGTYQAYENHTVDVVLDAKGIVIEGSLGSTEPSNEVETAITGPNGPNQNLPD
jgi:hypothetical protein